MKKQYDYFPRHSEIFDYWKTKVITKDYDVIDFVENKSAKGHVVIQDWGEPECWCCGKYNQDIYKNNTYNNDLRTKTGIKRIWNYKGVQSMLNRCHIYPKALGGSYSPSNLFLLCEECHRLSPDTTNPKIFFAWILNRRRKDVRDINGYNDKDKEELLTEIESFCSNFNIDKIKLMEYIIENKEELDEFISDNTNLHGFGMARSSIIGSMVDSYINKNKEKGA